MRNIPFDIFYKPLKKYKYKKGKQLSFTYIIEIFQLKKL